MTDPDVDAAEQHARAYVARSLKPYLVAGVSPDDLAAHVVAWIRREGWWPALKPPASRSTPTQDQAVAVTKRGAELARKLLTTPREDDHA